MSSEVNAWMLTGVSWMFCSRLRAVTMISSTVGCAPASSAATGTAYSPDTAAIAAAIFVLRNAGTGPGFWMVRLDIGSPPSL